MDEHTSFAVAAFAVYGSSAAAAIAAMYFGYDIVALVAILGGMMVSIKTDSGDDDV
ncbi:hypothetical protein HALG_00032 [Halorubrum virus CGphi46]|uniref:Uncharacterized protein n=1 Tax=Halorubrum virus CGphi46 TaxID=754066 RepID=R9TNV4_9CAUD|nr:hypothetical protein HALG_00032 [Halorubrum virus CGphi46]AGN33820.1 hypothetical protein HALG_00032 [Halorubrum virus CGphi46]